MFDPDDILHQGLGALEREEARLVLEQAVHGIESYDELTLHPLLAAGLAQTGLGVLRERRLPAEWKRKPTRRDDLPSHSDRQRCDLVLTPSPGQMLDDELVVVRTRARRLEQARGTLFEGLAQSPDSHALDRPACTGELIAPEECFWLEVKLVGQFCYEAGVPGPNRAYASQLTRGVIADLKKLRADERVERGGVLLVHFGAGAEVARHDLDVLVHRCLDAGVLVRPPAVSGFGMSDRIGNTRCTLALIQPAGGE